MLDKSKIINSDKNVNTCPLTGRLSCRGCERRYLSFKTLASLTDTSVNSWYCWQSRGIVKTVMVMGRPRVSCEVYRSLIGKINHNGKKIKEAKIPTEGI